MTRLSRSRAAAAVLLAGYAAVAGATRRFTIAAGLAVLAAGATLLGVALFARAPRVRPPSRPAAGWLAWATLAAAIGVWSILGLVQHGPPHPTLSTLAAERLHGWSARAGAFALWLVGGFLLVRPARLRRP